MANNEANLYTNKDGPDKTAQVDKSKMTGNSEKQRGRRALYWREVERYNRAMSTWHEEGENIVDVYLDANRTTGVSRKFCLLWSNVEVLKPAVYTKTPTVQCTRRFKDRDPIARTAAELMDRAANVSFELYNIDEVFRMVRDDRLLPGRGQAWVRYDATIEEYDLDESTHDNDGQPAKEEQEKGSRLKSERVCIDYVHWKDFGHNIARTWGDVWLVWRVVFKSQDEVSERFGADVAAKLMYNARSPAYGSGSAMDEPESRCRIYELWDKKRGLTSWIAEGHDDFLETGAPPINFESGFPCPEPCYASKTSKELIPRPDYNYYRDQAKEINDLTDKIGRLTQWLQVKGFIPGGPSSLADPLEEVLRDKTNAELFVQVDSMTEWQEKGGATKLIDWLPIENIVKALQAAISARAQLIQDVFQITGISDILRGQTDPNETLGAQELKAQTGTRRLRNTRDEIARFTRDIARLVCEVIADKFEPESIAEMTGFQYIPAPPMMDGMQLYGPGQPLPPMTGLREPGPAFGSSMGQYQAPPIGAVMPVSQPMGMLPPRMAPPGMPAPMQGQMPNQDQMQSDPNVDMTFDDRVMALLRNDKMRGFRIDIETDSTVQADQQAEKQSAMEFLAAVGPYMQQAVQAVEMAPALAPAFGEMLMMVVRRFAIGASLEETIEKSFQQMAQQVLQAKSQPPPEIAIEQAKAQAKAQGDQLHAQVKAQSDQANVQAKMASDQMQARTKAQSDLLNAQVKAHADQQHAALEIRKQQQDAALELRKQTLDHQAKLRETQMSAHAQAQDRQARLLAALKPTGKPS